LSTPRPFDANGVVSGDSTMNDKALLRKLKAIPAGARRDLRRALSGDSNVRADLSRQFYERDDTRSLAEVLMDLEVEDERSGSP
jgi:hypothetical protein